MKLAQGVVIERRNHVTGHGDFNVAADLVGDVTHQGPEPQDGTLDLDGFLQQQFAGFRQLELTRLAIDELASQPVLQPLQCAGNGGLLEAQSVSRPRHTSGLSQDDEGSQQVPVQFAGKPFRLDRA